MSYTQRQSPTKVTSFAPANAEVMCVCKPPHPARRLQSHKENENKDRFFYKCAQQIQCKFFLWEELGPDAGHRLGGSSQSQPHSQSQSQTQRSPPSTPQRPPASSPPKRPLPAVAASADAEDDFDWINDDEIELAATPSPSPSKKAKFVFRDSPAAPAPAPALGPASTISSPSKSEYDQIRNDPTSPFHSLHSNLFGSSTPSGGSPSKADGGVGEVQELLAMLQGMAPKLLSVQKELEKAQRLVQAAKKEKEFVVRLKERVRMLEEENHELKSRGNGNDY